MIYLVKNRLIIDKIYIYIYSQLNFFSCKKADYKKLPLYLIVITDLYDIDIKSCNVNPII